MIAGKGRSGTIAISYLVTYANWSLDKALQHFTTQRMRFGEGISIASQRRWVRYVELWSKQLHKEYSVSHVEVTEVQFWGMKLDDGDDKIEVGIAGYVEGEYPGSKAVNKIHVFEDEEVSSF
jgi:protein-tyrosine phosphatase